MTEPYQTLDLRYRPHNLDDLVGQDAVSRTIKGFLRTGRVPQSILLSGVYSTGKTTTGRLIATYLNCQNPTPVSADAGEVWAYGTPCGTCWSCLELGKSNPVHSDVHELNAGDANGVDDVRAWSSQSKYRPRSEFRVFLIDEAHALTGIAQKALLKPLEEPSAQTIWILCTSEPLKLMQEIRSRTVQLKLQPVSTEDCTALLTKVCAAEGFKLPGGSTKALKSIADAAQGHPRNALKILESVMNSWAGSDQSDLDPETLINKVAAEVVEEVPEVAARKFLFGVYGGKYTMPLTILGGITNPTMFVDALMSLHTHTLKYLASDTLVDKYFLDYYRKLEQEGFCSTRNIGQHADSPKHFLLDMTAVAQVTKVLFEAATQLKQYLVNPAHILTNMTCGAVSAMTSWQVYPAARSAAVEAMASVPTPKLPS